MPSITKAKMASAPNKSDDSDDAIWNYLKDMIWPTTATIVILSLIKKRELRVNS